MSIFDLPRTHKEYFHAVEDELRGQGEPVKFTREEHRLIDENYGTNFSPSYTAEEIKEMREDDRHSV